MSRNTRYKDALITFKFVEQDLLMYQMDEEEEPFETEDDPEVSEDTDDDW